MHVCFRSKSPRAAPCIFIARIFLFHSWGAHLLVYYDKRLCFHTCMFIVATNLIMSSNKDWYFADVISLYKFRSSHLLVQIWAFGHTFLNLYSVPWILHAATSWFLLYMLRKCKVQGLGTKTNMCGSARYLETLYWVTCNVTLLGQYGSLQRLESELRWASIRPHWAELRVQGVC